MPRVPFVGRLHLYLPPFRPRTNSSTSTPEFHTPEDDFREFDFTSGQPHSTDGSGGDGGGTVAATAPAAGSKNNNIGHPIFSATAAAAAERERLFYKFRQEREEERERLQKKKRQKWFKDEANAFFSSSLPFWARNSQEYVALVVSFCFLVVESVLRVITLALPTPIIYFFYQKSRTLFNAFSPASHTTKSSTRKEKSIVGQVREADGFVELCAIWGYEAEEHIVQTGDGYLLGLHRVRRQGVGEKRGRERSRGQGRSTGLEDDTGKKVVYLHHGLLMNSEVWVCLTEKERCLPFTLVDHGYDVWLGNNRGNKYSKKSIHHSSSSPQFWDFSMDEFAMHDIPDSINYILETTKSKSLSYIGFSQGTAQAFATLSIHPSLNEKVDVFIALAPAMSPAGLHNAVVDAFIKASPNILFLLFGRKSILSSATFWQSILYPPIFVRLIDASLTFLFDWRGRNISLNQKIAAYSHLYSFTSTKSVVHWFQIIRNKAFQMYDDDVQGVMNLYGRNFYRVAKFPTRNITTPVVLVWGGSDSLVDIGIMLKELPAHTVAKGIPHYEHLDMLWANDVDKLVHPTVLEALETYSYSCEGELGPVASKPTSSTVITNPRHSSPHSTSIPQLFVRRGSANFSTTEPHTEKVQATITHNGAGSESSPTFPPSSDDERNVYSVDSMDDEADSSSVAPPFHLSRIYNHTYHHHHHHHLHHHHPPPPPLPISSTLSSSSSPPFPLSHNRRITAPPQTPHSPPSITAADGTNHNDIPSAPSFHSLPTLSPQTPPPLFSSSFFRTSSSISLPSHISGPRIVNIDECAGAVDHEAEEDRLSGLVPETIVDAENGELERKDVAVPASRGRQGVRFRGRSGGDGRRRDVGEREGRGEVGERKLLKQDGEDGGRGEKVAGEHIDSDTTGRPTNNSPIPPAPQHSQQTQRTQQQTTTTTYKQQPPQTLPQLHREATQQSYQRRRHDTSTSPEPRFYRNHQAAQAQQQRRNRKITKLPPPTQIPSPPEPSSPTSPIPIPQRASSFSSANSAAAAALHPPQPPPAASSGSNSFSSSFLTNPIKEFFTQTTPGLFSRRSAAARRASSLSDPSGTVAGGGSLSDAEPQSGKVIGPAGILLARAGAEVRVSTQKEVEGLDEEERRRERRRRREREREIAAGLMR